MRVVGVRNPGGVALADGACERGEGGYGELGWVGRGGRRRKFGREKEGMDAVVEVRTRPVGKESRREGWYTPLKEHGLKIY